MNHPRSIYRSDYGPPSWFENNFSSDVDEFCSPDNIDDCLKYVSQEFNDLGYPSIYATLSTCPFSVNCDIVQLLNVIFEILKDLKVNAACKEELDSRNQRLESDFNVLNKKNTQLKEHLEQTNRKLNSSLERERQLKVKNEQLQNLLKTEKEVSKKLSAQIQQQKAAYQRESRKKEHNLTQMKNKLNQVLVDKNPDKKIAKISTSHLLQRSTNQRGKWKTESLAKSSADEMYNSIITAYENRCQTALKEIGEYKHFVRFIEQKLIEMLSFVEEISNQPCLNAILAGNNIQEELMQKFSALCTQVQNIITNKISDNKNLSQEVMVLKSEILILKNKGNITDSSPQEKNSNMNLQNNSFEVSASPNDERLFKSEEDKSISEQKKELAVTLAQIKEEKSKLEAQKLVLIKSAIKQKSSNIAQCSKSVPSFSIVTTKSGVKSVPATHQLKQCLSYPDTVKSMSPLWKVDLLSPTQSSPSTPVFEDCLSSPFLSFTSPESAFLRFTSPESFGNDTSNDDMPNWARSALSISVSEEDSLNIETFETAEDLTKTHSVSDEAINASAILSEEDKLAKLKAVAEDIENRRNNFFSKRK